MNCLIDQIRLFQELERGQIAGKGVGAGKVITSGMKVPRRKSQSLCDTSQRMQYTVTICV